VPSEGQTHVVQVMIIEALFRNELVKWFTSASNPTDLVHHLMVRGFNIISFFIMKRGILLS
jgi:hypothetical protein